MIISLDMGVFTGLDSLSVLYVEAHECIFVIVFPSTHCARVVTVFSLYSSLNQLLHAGTCRTTRFHRSIRAI
jgi:hypothetical protein